MFNNKDITLKIQNNIKKLIYQPTWRCTVPGVLCQAGWLTSWNQDCCEKYQQLQICRRHNSNGREQRGTEEPLKHEREEWKRWLKTQHSETKIIRSDQSLSRVRLFVTPWIAACQASLSITNSRSSLRSHITQAMLQS